MEPLQVGLIAVGSAAAGAVLAWLVTRVRLARETARMAVQLEEREKAYKDKLTLLAGSRAEIAPPRTRSW